MNIMLSNTRLFRGIGSDELPLLLQCLGAAQKHYDRGETILAEGAPTEQLGMVLTGMAMIGYDDVWAATVCSATSARVKCLPSPMPASRASRCSSA